MTTAFVLAGLLTLAACEEQVSKGNELTAQELEYLRTRASEKCKAEQESTFRNIISNSNNAMLDFDRNQTFKIEYLKGKESLETSYLHVWKVTPPDVYFLYVENKDGSATNRFIKIDTTQNELMFRALLAKKCAKSINITGSSTLTATVEGTRTQVDSENWTKTNLQYRINPSYPAYFGSINLLRTKETSNSSSVVTKTETYEYTFSTNAAASLPASYTSIASPLFCTPKDTGTPGDYVFPFVLNCVSGATPEFDPAEL